MRLTTPAFVLRRVRWSESSLILTLYSLDLGRASGMARGCLRPKGNFLGRVELFSEGEFCLSRREGRELDTVVEASVLAHRGGLREDPLAFAAAAVFSEWLLSVVSYGNEPSEPVYHLLDNVFSLLEGGASPMPVLCGGIQRLLALSGHGMQVEACALCGKPDPSPPRWNPSAGGVVCSGCAPGGEPVAPGLLGFLAKSAGTPLEKVVKVRLWPGGFRQCLDLLRVYTETHLEKRLPLKALRIMEDMLDAT